MDTDGRCRRVFLLITPQLNGMSSPWVRRAVWRGPTDQLTHHLLPSVVTQGSEQSKRNGTVPERAQAGRQTVCVSDKKEENRLL